MWKIQFTESLQNCPEREIPLLQSSNSWLTWKTSLSLSCDSCLCLLTVPKAWQIIWFGVSGVCSVSGVLGNDLQSLPALKVENIDNDLRKLKERKNYKTNWCCSSSASFAVVWLGPGTHLEFCYPLEFSCGCLLSLLLRTLLTICGLWRIWKLLPVSKINSFKKEHKKPLIIFSTRHD